VGLILVLLTACDPGAKAAKGFRLPEGDIERGKQAFVALECNRCHTVSGVQLAKHVSPGKFSVALGGEVIKVKTYGQLVTSIINPSHNIAKSFDRSKLEGEGSPMPQVNDKMIVQQMIDLVAFLHSRYILLEPDYSEYSYYP